ncbi:major facilitator superfamily domain-containing protein [Bisporella sp. PMI_857]|nr:major facilitator superfamily domain-containing protein [Bisporella sp. PMI_857]
MAEFTASSNCGGTEAEQSPPSPLPPIPAKRQAHGSRFWGIFGALCLLAFISALDVAIITTALPTITAEIGGSKQYVWIANSFVLASSVPQPLFGQLANIFGRRKPLIASVMLFTLGSGVAGGAVNPAMLIAGRTVQGLGAGGIYVLLDIVCCDLVPLRERGKYLVLGGAIAEANWRWIFYLNIPTCALALAAILFFMRVKEGRGSSDPISKGRSRFWQLDYVGNLIFIPSMVAILLGLVMGGIEHPWSSWRIFLPLVLGSIGWIVFHIHQAFCSYPSIPARLFSNRTSATAFILTFLSSALVQANSYFLPIYFQAVLSTTVLRSGTYFLPFAIGTLVSAAGAGVALSKLGVYRPLHAGAFALSAVGFGLFTLLNGTTSKVAWVFYQLIASFGAGMIMSVLLPAIMAALPESDVASASATYSFVRTFGYIWGVTIPSIIFNGVFNKNLSRISSPELQSQLRDGVAYSFASQAHRIRPTLDAKVWEEVVEVYAKSLRTIWWVGLGVSLVGFFLVGAERGLELRKELDTEYGINDEKSTTAEIGTRTEEGLEVR